MRKILLICILWLLWALPAQAEPAQYQVEITAPVPLKDLLKKHLDMVKWRDNPRMSPAEWKRLFSLAQQNIKDLIATEGYFAAKIYQTLESQNGTYIAKFVVEAGAPVLVSDVALSFTGDISTQAADAKPNAEKLRESWFLQKGAPFRQESWNQAKRKLLTEFLVERYPNASISNSKAEVNLETQTITLTVEVNSGNAIRFGDTTIIGLERYRSKVVENLNPIKPGDIYNQSDLVTFQTRLQESGYFQTVEVTADTLNSTNSAEPNIAPIKVKVIENRSIKMGIGAGYSTNTGPRLQLSVEHLNLFNKGWKLSSNLKLENNAQVLTSEIHLPTTKSGYRDSINANASHTLVEGLDLTVARAGVKRAWGDRKREQYVSANLLTESSEVEGASSDDSTYAATLGYGIILRRTDNDLSPTRGYLLNVQFTGAPFTSTDNGSFLQSHVKTQAYYPITSSTQLIARAEVGMVNGKNSAPELYLFRAGGDQSVRGYAYQSLGVTEGDAIVGGRYIATGSVEVVQWLTSQWGAAVFVDAGNAGNSLQDLSPVYGYGLGARWKSPLGPIGADIAYGESTGEYRFHFNIGVAF
ncbi:MAG: autotransporter assembly complex protein TamA [Methylotenera sp.]|uniref:autotransporter assembly complex protein TamA n=1 Tax=Methylotenera sp. TaxID=2051956 RepID=UPI0024884E30|nr:autotransporter assembly complex family protein [Methylotenera sp.]MDI1309890.1 autotransporter assembly complex protein TamA [Methylotenera sp.]